MAFLKLSWSLAALRRSQSVSISRIALKARLRNTLFFNRRFGTNAARHSLDCGNYVTALHDGNECFPAMLNAIDNAKNEILLEMYWFQSDKAGWVFASHLISAAERGISVRLIYDAFGCLETNKNLWDTLRKAGCEVQAYNPFIRRVHSPNKLGVFLRRDHRKLLVVDRLFAFTGGMNIANHWLPVEEGGHNWRDIMILLEGPSVEAFAQVTLRMLDLLQEAHDDHSLFMYIRRMRKRFRYESIPSFAYPREKMLQLLPHFSTENEKDTVGQKVAPTSHAWWSAQGRLKRSFVDFTEKYEIPMLEHFRRSAIEKTRFSQIQLITNDAWGDRRSIRRGYIRAINSAKRDIIIANAYFLPDRSIRRALYRAVRRGVQVRVIVPGKSDHELVRLATQARYQVFLRQGVELYEWIPSVLHSKVAVFDEEVSVVGTYNFDPVSFRSNLEIVAVLHHSGFSKELSERLKQDIAQNCKRISQQSWPGKAICDEVILSFNRLFNLVFKRITNI